MEIMKTHSITGSLALIALSTLVWLTAPADALAQNPTGENAINGGFGFQVGMTRWAPGGFKWFNEYNRGFTDMVWLNVGFNVTLGDMDDDRCWYDNRRDRWYCDEGHWDGNSLQFIFGVKLRFELSKVPIVVDAILNGALDVLFFGGDYAGVAIGFRGGPGIHYFFFDNLGVGMKFTFMLGPAFTKQDGAEFYGSFDFQVLGIEFRF
jgi:hypothetical protein